MSKFVDDFNQARAFSKFTKGAEVVLPRSGTRYVLAEVHPTASGVPQATVRRAVQKLSKAAKKAAKKARRGKPRGLL
jgi:hypothetical protein